MPTLLRLVSVVCLLLGGISTKITCRDPDLGGQTPLDKERKLLLMGGTGDECNTVKVFAGYFSLQLITSQHKLGATLYCSMIQL